MTEDLYVYHYDNEHQWHNIHTVGTLHKCTMRGQVPQLIVHIAFGNTNDQSGGLSPQYEFHNAIQLLPSGIMDAINPGSITCKRKKKPATCSVLVKSDVQCTRTCTCTCRKCCSTNVIIY